MSRRGQKSAGQHALLGALLAVTLLAALGLVAVPHAAGIWAAEQRGTVGEPVAIDPPPSVNAEPDPTPTPAAQESAMKPAGGAAFPTRPPVVNYIVLPGDTLLELADEYETTVERLLEINPGLDPARIVAGQLIKVPDRLAGSGVARPQFIWPADGPITTPYGERGSSWIGGVHPGLDIGGGIGDYVWSAAEGVIVNTGTDGLGRGYGTYIVVNHGDGWSTLYAHLSAVYRGIGHAARRGEPIGEVGETGFAYGPHLHFEVWHRGERQDPIQFLP